MSRCPHCHAEMPDGTACPSCAEHSPCGPVDTGTESLTGTMRLRLIEPCSGIEFALPSPAALIIGRSDDGWSPDIDLRPVIRLAQHGVSRRHAQLTVRGFYVTICDAQSTNGTLVNGKPLHPHTPYALHDGDRIDCGQIALIFRAT